MFSQAQVSTAFPLFVQTDLYTAYTFLAVTFILGMVVGGFLLFVCWKLFLKEYDRKLKS